MKTFYKKEITKLKILRLITLIHQRLIFKWKFESLVPGHLPWGCQLLENFGFGERTDLFRYYPFLLPLALNICVMSGAVAAILIPLGRTKSQTTQMLSLTSMSIIAEAAPPTTHLWISCPMKKINPKCSTSPFFATKGISH